MPNYVSNSLTVEGPDADAFFAAIEGAVSGDFINHLVPMPEELREIRSGDCTIDGEHVTAWRVIDDKDVPLTDIERQYLTDLYGTVDWYKWALQNWGTKWGACDVQRKGNRIHFDSAWSPPSTAVMRISEMFPSTVFTLAFAESGAGFWGMEVHVNGGIVDTHESDQFFVADARWDDEDADITAMLTPECAAHLEQYGLGMGG